MATIGLIAGGGRFPLLFAESARRAGHRVGAAAHVNQTEPALEGLVDACTWVKLGQFGKVVEVLKGAYKIVYRSKLPLKEALAQVKGEMGEHPEIAHWVGFIETSERGILR